MLERAGARIGPGAPAARGHGDTWAATSGWRERPGQPDVLRWLAALAVLSIIGLIGSGAWVRLSSSGLGCPTWPNCTRASVIAPASYHALVEFVNRCIITTVGVVVGLSVVASLLRRPFRRDLVLLSGGLVAGYLGEAVLGGVTVLMKLAPTLVAAHLVLAMLLLVDAVVLHWRAGSRERSSQVAVHRGVTLLADLMLLAALIVVVAGAVVAGTGPHSGSPGTPRFHLDLRSTAEFHALVGMFLFGLVVAAFFLLFVLRAPRAAWRRYSAAVGLLGLQGALGYATWFSHIEVDVTEAHVFVAGLLVVALVRFRLGFSSARPPTASAVRSVVLVEVGVGGGPQHQEPGQ
jgi:cytochrome c oxidase assembly protein subunit 15